MNWRCALVPRKADVPCTAPKEEWPAGHGADFLEQILRRSTKMTRALGQLSQDERLEELGLFSLEKKRFGKHLPTTSQYLNGATRYMRTGFLVEPKFTIIPYTTRGNGFKLKEDRFKLDKERYFLQQSW